MLGSLFIWSPFHRSHIVVAPCSTKYPHDGYSVASSNRYATSARPVSVSALNKYGVPKNPVPSRQRFAAIRSTSRCAASGRTAGGSKSIASASTYPVWVSTGLSLSFVSVADANTGGGGTPPTHPSGFAYTA